MKILVLSVLLLIFQASGAADFKYQCEGIAGINPQNQKTLLSSLNQNKVKECSLIKERSKACVCLAKSYDLAMDDGLKEDTCKIDCPKKRRPFIPYLSSQVATGLDVGGALILLGLDFILHLIIGSSS